MTKPIDQDPPQDPPQDDPPPPPPPAPRGNKAARLAVSPVDLAPVQDEIRALQVQLAESEKARQADAARIVGLEKFAEEATAVLKGRGLFEELERIANKLTGGGES